MIINTKQNEAEFFGEIQENRVGIDAKNIDFIAVLLTSNLYSQPFESFLRETVSNAYDSHREAGTKEPILMLIGGSYYGEIEVSIRDYGVGISPKRFEQIYRNIGSSTKRESNDFIGMFGIGRFSVLSCTDVANITSYYNGRKYSYLMYKNNGGINIDKIGETTTDLKNGLEVSAKIKGVTTREFRQALYSLSMFKNLHVECSVQQFAYECKAFNERKVYRTDNILTCNILGDQHFKVGNVLYPINMVDSPLKTQQIIIELPMGQVDITPNRENLQYTEFTRNTIKKSVQQAKDKLTELVKDKFVNGTLNDYCKLVSNYYYPVLIGDEFTLSVSKHDVDLDGVDAKVNGEDIPKRYAEFIGEMRFLYPGKDRIYKILTNSRRFKDSIRAESFLCRDDLVGIKTDDVTKGITLQYFKQKYDKDIIIFTKEGFDNYKEFVLKQTKLLNTLGHPNIAKSCVDFTFKHLKVINISNDAVPEDYIKKYKEANKTKTQKPDDYLIPVRHYYSGSYRIMYHSSISDLEKWVKFAVYDTNTKDDETMRRLSEILQDYRIMNLRHKTPSLITLKKDDVDLLKNRKKFVHLNDFLYLRNNFWEKLTTAAIIYQTFNKFGMYKVSSIPIYREFVARYPQQIACFTSNSYNELLKSTIEYYKNKGWYNKSDVEYFSLTEKDTADLEKLAYIKDFEDDFIERITYEIIGRNERIGIKLPKSNIINKVKNESFKTGQLHQSNI